MLLFVRPEIMTTAVLITPLESNYFLAILHMYCIFCQKEHRAFCPCVTPPRDKNKTGCQSVAIY